MPKEALKSQQVYVDYLKERIYGVLTVMAVNVGLLMSAEKLTIAYASITISLTTFGLWGASMLASYTAHRVAHDSALSDYRWGHELVVHRGLVLAGVPSLLMLMLAGLGFIDLSTALLADIALSVVSLLVTLAKSAKTKENSLGTAVVVGVAHCIVVSVIILLKSLAK